MEIEVPESVQAFNFWTLLIMARLWDEFPRPLWFNSTPIAVHVTSDRNTKGDPIGPEGSEQVELFTHTLSWLIREGFATGVPLAAAGAFTNVRLTTKGFTILNQVPRSIDSGAGTPDKQLGTLFREAAARHGPDIAATLIQKLLLP